MRGTNAPPEGSNVRSIIQGGSPDTHFPTLILCYVPLPLS